MAGTGSELTDMVSNMHKSFLSEPTRRNRRNLLLFCFLPIFIIKTGLLPTKISALGIELEASNIQSLMWCFGVLIIYFLVAFLLYCILDMNSYNARFISMKELVKRSGFGPSSDLDYYITKNPTKVFLGLRVSYWITLAFEAGLPLLLAGMALAIIFSFSPF